MSKITEILVEKVIWPLVILILTPVFTLIGSKFQSGDWLAWLKLIPSWGYWLFFGITVVWFLVSLIVRRIRHLRERNLPSTPPFYSIPRWGYLTVGKLKYQGVQWKIRIPAPSP